MSAGYAALMFRGFVYSILAVSFFLTGSVFWMLRQDFSDEAMVFQGGWILLVSFFAVGPLFFVLGYWHHRRLHKAEPQWDAEIGE
jgi:sterol desaturase/sphingolipid hydroxylase (fatty acid hydroxylase superfamily)